MERKRIYKLKWIRAKRKLQYLLDQMLRMNKKMKQVSTHLPEEKVRTYQEEVRHLNTMLKQQHALVRFYEEKVRK